MTESHQFSSTCPTPQSKYNTQAYTPSFEVSKQGDELILCPTKNLPSKAET